jgi:lipopolysaccharide transport system ATP-binding protein
MSNVVIRAEDISKQYRLGLVGTGTVKDDFKRWYHKVQGKEDPFLKIGDSNDRSTKGESNYVWSLKDINFEINQGDSVGIIGKNGAGKSTLLKILSQVTQPSTGKIYTKGRIASLLEVGTGFHPEMTGRENIYLNGAILGMRKKEIARKMEEIIDFSGVERYIDTPVKRYSSGMYVRLAFAVAAHLESEILIVDEVLAVGDAEFQKKCLGKMGDVTSKDGRTVLFVSHNLGAVKSLCSKGIVLSNGLMSYSGNASEALTQYELSTDLDLQSSYSGDGIIKNIIINNNEKISYFDKFNLEIKFNTITYINNPILGLVIKDMMDNELMTINNKHYNKQFLQESKLYKGSISLFIDKLQLIPGNYKADVYFGDGTVDLEIVKNIIVFEVSVNTKIEFINNIDFKSNKIFHQNTLWDLKTL